MKLTNSQKLLRSTLMPLKIKDFSQETQTEFCQFVRERNSLIDDLLKKSSYRYALETMLRRSFHDLESQLAATRFTIDGDPLYLSDEQTQEIQNKIKLIKREWEIAAACCDEPSETIDLQTAWASVYFFEDLSVIENWYECYPQFSDNYFSYIYNEIDCLFSQMNYQNPEIKGILERAGVTFRQVSDGCFCEYNEHFRDNLFVAKKMIFKK